MRLEAQGYVSPADHIWITDLGCAPKLASTLYFSEWVHYLDAESSYQVAWVVVSAETQRGAAYLSLGAFRGEISTCEIARNCREADIWLREAIVGEDTLLDMEQHNLELLAQRHDELAAFIKTAEGQRVVEMLYRLQRAYDADRTPETLQKACEGLLALAVGRFLGVGEPATFELSSFRDVHQDTDEADYFMEIDDDLDF